MKMRMLGNRWYSNFWYEGRKIQVALNAWGGTPTKPPNKAYIELGELLSDLHKGINPSGVRKSIKSIVLHNPSKRTQQVLRSHIFPFFGDYKWGEVDKDLIEKYFEHRWGLTSEGELRGSRSTVDKELRALTQLMRVVDKRWELPKVRYQKIKKEILPPLTHDQINLVLNHLPKKYHAVYWVMAYTAMDISDAISLSPSELVDGWIIKHRGKSGLEIAVPVCKPLLSVLRAVPQPLDKGVSLFPEINPKATSTAIRRAFIHAGLEGYGAKYLRRFVASKLLDAGYTMDWIGKALAHADGSKITQRYTKVYKSTLESAFAKLG